MKLYLYDIREPIPEAAMEGVAPGRRARARQYLRETDRLRCLAAGVLLARELGVHRDEDLVTGAYGKPSLRDGRAHFNLSHAGFYAVLAVAEQPIGVDIEPIQPFDWHVARRCFTGREMEWLEADASDSAFCRLWTGKEAIMKATGNGFALDPASFCVLPVRDGEHHIMDKRWLMTWRIIENHMICIAHERG